MKNVKKEFLNVAGFTLDSGIKNEFRGNARSLLRAIARGNGFSQTQAEEEEEIEEEEQEEQEEENEDSIYPSLEEEEEEEVVNRKPSVYIQNQLSGLGLAVKDDQGSGAQVF